MSAPYVIKIGGSTLGAHDTTLEDVAALHRQGTPLVVVHGGGASITAWMARSGVEARFVRGLRVTDPATLEVVVAVLAGLVNKELVAAFQARGVPALGLSGADGGLFRARVQDEALGRVGEVVAVDLHPVLIALEHGYLPVIAPLALDDDPEGPSHLLNINADTAAGKLAIALRAAALVFSTDVPGVLDEGGALIPELSAARARHLLDTNVASGGMVPKLQAALEALAASDGGLPVHIVDGRQPAALRHAVQGEKVGTRIRGG
jgi:acetylglutamate kinase